MINAISSRVRAFLREERGVALTEYLMILGLLVGSIIVAIGLFATNMSDVFLAFANWVGSLVP